MIKERLLDVREVSGLLCIHPETLYRWKKSGRIPHIMMNGRVRFERKAVDEFLEKRKSGALDLEAILPKFDLSLDSYDRLHLKRRQKGGTSAVGKDPRRRWNYSFGSVYLRGNHWYIDYRYLGKRIRETVKDAQTRGEAVIALQTKVAEIFEGKFAPFRKSGSMSFSAFADLYLEDYAKANKRSWKTDRSCLKKMKDFFGSRPLQNISPLDIEKLKMKRLEEGVTKSTVNRYVQLLKRMFTLAIDWEYASENPARKARLFSEKDNLKERILTAEEEVRLLDASPEHLKPIIIMALHTGMRRGEVLGLRWMNVDFEGRLIKVEKSKNGEQRFIEINGTLLELLRRLRLSNPGVEFVFSNFKTGQPFVEVGKAFRRAAKIAGISGVRFHDLRHSFASRLIEAGTDIITVKELLGHSSVKITERYTHTRSDLKRRAVEKLQPKIPETLAQIWHKNQKGDQKIPSNLYFSMN